MVKKYTKENPLRVFTAFSGYDSQCLALNRLGIDYDLVGWSEIDPAAIKAHDALFPQYADRNYGDISKIDWSQVPDFDLFTYSSPCTDFSNAGQQAGGEEGSGTRSSLLWECRKTILAKKPKYLMFENVKYTNFSVSGGYAYNWVFAHNWLLCSSLSLSMGYKRASGDLKKDELTILRDFSFKNVVLDGQVP